MSLKSAHRSILRNFSLLRYSGVGNGDPLRHQHMPTTASSTADPLSACYSRNAVDPWALSQKKRSDLNKSKLSDRLAPAWTVSYLEPEPLNPVTTCDLGFSDGVAVCGPHTQEQPHRNRRAQFSGHCIWPVGSRLSGLRRGQVCHLAVLFVINKSPHIQGSTSVSVNREQRSPLTLEDHLLKYIVDYDRGGSGGSVRYTMCNIEYTIDGQHFADSCKR